MKVKEVSLVKIIMLGGLVVAILYSLYLGMENVALTAIGVIGGYLVKDIEIRNDTSNKDESKEHS